MTKINLFMDMDGVLAEQQDDLRDFMYDKDFFLNRPPVHSMLSVSKKLAEASKENNANCEVYVLTSIVDSEYCENEKGLWLDKQLPEIKRENRLYVPSGRVKSEFVKENVDTENAINVLMDDYTENLDTWDFKGALPIKVLNGLNNNNGTWLAKDGHAIDAYADPDFNVSEINRLIELKKLAMSNLP